jgi:hypothetical protein
MLVAQSRRGPSKTLEAAQQAKARNAARQALDGLLAGLDDIAQHRMADAALDAATALHAKIHGPDVTAPRLSKTAGLIYPSIRRAGREDADAFFAKAVA